MHIRKHVFMSMVITTVILIEIVAAFVLLRMAIGPIIQVYGR